MATPSQRAALTARASEVRRRFVSELILRRWCEVLALEASVELTSTL